MIRVIPSISILGGKTAKLISGDYKNAQLFEKSPLDLAKYFEDNGAEWLHLVDLDGANVGQVKNEHILEVLAAHTNLKISFSGGIRTSQDVSTVLKAGAKSVTLATLAVEKPEIFMDLLITYGRNRLVLGADIKDGKIVTRGWQANSNKDAWDHVQYFNDRSVQFVKITDVNRDGNLEGPNFDLYKAAADRFPNIEIVASGGVRSLADIEKLNEIGVWGVIVARALYEDKLHVEDLQPYFNQSV
jgi:phosphoribosylformimino-5-aminoimidazole carboxamide ribotide isomerase